MDAPTEYKQFSDEDNEPGPSTNQTRRGTRACDRCRKIKSKCEGTDGDKCRNCLQAGTPCTFQGPSFKRGPPKGYIHAIEQRWHQVECILGTIMASSRASGIIADLRQDPFARDVLDRVATGPYGLTGRPRQPSGAVEDPAGFYNTIMTQSQQHNTYDDRRSKRQSRLTRELVSTQDVTVPAVPTAEWQDQLYRRLSNPPSSGIGSPRTSYSSSSEPTRLTAWSSSNSTSPLLSMPTSLPGMSGEPSRRRRRLDTAYVPSDMQHPTQPYDQIEHEEEYDDTVSALGHLSVDENREIRYHGRSAGLHLLAKSDRTDDSQQKENGIWKFHMLKVDTENECLSFEHVNERIRLPDERTQDELINLYFTYVHPSFPVLHKSSFLQAYYQRTIDHPRPSTQREPMQQVTKLLLLAMFAFAARYMPRDLSAQEETPASTNWLLQAGMEYAIDARRLLNTVYEDSRPSICQALLLLGLREYGIGCTAQGWAFTGMGCRMAIDLGMNRDADGWKDSRGNDLFNPVEKQTRKQIWWSCCTADKLSSVYLGRPVMFRKGEHDTPEPAIDANADELWRPYPLGVLGPEFTPVPANVMSCFREQCKLSTLTSEIMTRVYPVMWSSDMRRRELNDLDKGLGNWLINLSEDLKFNDVTKRPLPAPHILALHIEYYSALLLLHRAFLPDWDGEMKFTPGHLHDPVALKSFDTCQATAAHISSLISLYDEVYGLARAPPLLTIYLQSAGIMHVVTLNQRPRDTQASIGLLQCIEAAEEMSTVWPAAIRIRNLLKGAKVQLDDYSTSHRMSNRPKRRAEEPLTDERSEGIPHQLYANPTLHPSTSYGHLQPQQAYPAMSYGAALPTVPYLPGSEWWPQLIGPAAGQGLPQQGYHYPPTTVGTHLSGLPQSLFTFDSDQLSSDFMQGVPHDASGIPPHYPHTRQ